MGPKNFLITGILDIDRFIFNSKTFFLMIHRIKFEYGFGLHLRILSPAISEMFFLQGDL